MSKKIGVVLVLFLLIGAADAIENTYNKHNVSFQIPANWSIAKDAQDGSDTQVVLTNGDSTIRLDIVDMPELVTIRNVSSDDYSYSLGSLVLGYYQKSALKGDYGQLNAMSSTDKPNPDGSRSVSFGVAGEGQEWVLVWSKPEYGGKFIGAHAIFDGNFSVVDLGEGKGRIGDVWKYYMPTLFYDLLDSFRANFGTTAKKTYGMPVQQKTFRKGTMQGGM